MRYQNAFLFLLAAAWPLAAQTGAAVPALTGLDRAMTTYLAASKTPGGALAVARGGRLVYARGFGLADTALQTAVQPDSLFRIGSISKPITSMTALRLVQDGKLSLDAPIVPLLGDPVLPAGSIVDPRWNQITVRHLLQHSGGWDAGASFDPLVSYAVLDGLGLSLPLRQPLTVDDVIRFMARQPLQFAPGTKYTYSNFGMMLLGRVIERVAGTGYEQLVKSTVLEPMGIQRMALGGALPSQRRPGEVDYYDPSTLPAVYPGIGNQVPAADGGYYFEIIQGAGAWIASPVDLVRFADGVDGRKGTALLRPDLVQQIAARPNYESGEAYYGLGWVIDRSLGGLTLLHNGAIEGTFALLVRTELAGGVTFALTFNGTPQSETAPDALLEAVIATLLTVNDWPTGDAFDAYLPPTAPRISGVVDAAGRKEGIAPGSLVTLYGMNLGPAVPVGATVASGQVATSAGGVQVLFDGIPSPLLLAGRNQIDAVAPLALGSATTTRIEVIRDGQRSVAWTAPVQSAAPGLFSISGNGRGLLAALRADGSINSEETPAARGSIVTLWGAGLSGFTTPLRDGQIAEAAIPLRTLPRFTVNDEPAEVIYAGAAPGFVAGALQINLRIPESVPPGRVFLRMSEAGAASREGVWIWVE
jgi:N-acyl-D-amino-acid deacylase